jgi:predicted transcriptional regulator YdeE
MHTTEPTANTLHIVGLELRTDNQQAAQTIPAHWARFQAEQVLARLNGRLDDVVHAVYTHFAHPGQDNLGTYSLIIGAQVAESSAVPAGLVHTTIAPQRRAVFPVANGRFDLVGEAWQRIWATTDLDKTYLCDFERYQPNGQIDILVGIR